MVFTAWEVVQAVIMTGVVGWIFKDMFAPQGSPDEYIRRSRAGTVGWHEWLYAALLVAPAIILHELGHKFVALGFGLEATFNAAWLFLALGVVMKLVGGFIFFVPAYVSIVGSAPAWVFGLAALAGPLVNFSLWGLAYVAPGVRRHFRGRKVSHKEFVYWATFAKINLFLGVFNLIPIPGFDGFQVVRAVIGMF